MSKKMTQQFLCSKMMLPEHCSGLRKYAEDKKWAENHRRPLLDEQFREELQQILELAMAEQQPLKFTVLDSGGYRAYSGIPLRSDPATGLIYLRSGSSRLQAVKASEVVGIEPF